MSQEENASPWKKKEAQESLRDDRKSRFALHDEAVNEKRRNTAAHDQRVQNREDERSRWTGESAAPRTPGGAPADAELAKLQTDVYAERTALRRTPVTHVTMESVAETVAALFFAWKVTPSGKNYVELFEQNPWNDTQMNNIAQSLLQKGHPVNTTLPVKTFEIAYAGNHLDPRKRRDRAGNVVHLRGEARRAAPTPFPRVIWADEQADTEREAQEKAAAADALEKTLAKALPFDELKRQATKDRKHDAPLMGPRW